VLGWEENIYEEGSVVWIDVNGVGIWRQTRTSLNKAMRNLLRDKDIVFDKVEHNRVVLNRYHDNVLSSQYIIDIR
ncbi:MAG: hypothetical protein ACRC7W_00425, partial [Fusobacteriaceae bacterium]